MPLNSGDILRITAKMSLLSQDVQNVFHARAGGASADTDSNIVDDCAAAMETMWATIYGALDDRLNFDTVSVYNVTGDRFMGEVAWPSLTTGGYSTSKTLPMQAAALIRFPTATLGRQGRKFLGGLGDNLINDDSTLTSAFSAALVSFISVVLAGITGSDYSASFGVFNPDTSSFAAFVRGIVNAYCGTQGRRRPGVGS